jgi:hypothetical protein
MATRQIMWDEKEDPSMSDEMFKGNGHPRIMIVKLQDMAHSFVL